MNIEVKNEITAMTKVGFIKMVTEISCPSDEEYYEALRNIGFDYAILAFLSDYDGTVGEMSLGEIEKVISDNMSSIDDIKKKLPTTLLPELNRGIDIAIEAKTGVKVNNISKAVTNLISTIQDKIENIDTKNLDSFIRNFSKFDEKKIAETYFQNASFEGKR